ncbi:hypothetical protein FMV2238Y02_13930 [Streptococcus canis]|uniref:Uncharacterized protein n=1 Tax=Streptococcus canis TaxID=1329 RepID=A0A3P5XQ89_STRCB|nr:hypothetical protein [Streptococcus canis]VDC42918.1 hypothetical protein FMV2238Y02_13930 [Streptococcus canis]
MTVETITLYGSLAFLALLLDNELVSSDQVLSVKALKEIILVNVYVTKRLQKGAGQKVQLLILFKLALQDAVVDWQLCSLVNLQR